MLGKASVRMLVYFSYSILFEKFDMGENFKLLIKETLKHIFFILFYLPII